MACRATFTYRGATATGVTRAATATAATRAGLATVTELRCVDSVPWALADDDGYYVLTPEGDLIDIGVPA